MMSIKKEAVKASFFMGRKAVKILRPCRVTKLCIL